MAFLLAAVFTTPAAAATGNVLLRVQDARTHHPIHATIHLDGPESPLLETDDLGYIRRPLAAGDYRVTISAPGYSVRKTHFNVSPARDLNFHIMLDSETLPEEERPEVINTRLRPGFTLFHGYVVDAASGQPLPGVRISSTGARVEATTDAKGHYWLSVVTPPELPTGRPGRDTLTYEKQGYETIIYENVNIFGDETGPGEALDMEKGTGIDRRDGRNKLERQAETGKDLAGYALHIKARPTNRQQPSATPPPSASNTMRDADQSVRADEVLPQLHRHKDPSP